MFVTIPYSVARQIADHAASMQPSEACGLLAGRDGRILAAYPLKNVAPSPHTRFQIDAGEQLKALKAFDRNQLDWIGAYHSHPRSAPIPSPSDIEECADSGLLHLIVSLKRREPQLKLWRISPDSIDAIELVYDTESPPAYEGALSFSQRAAVIIVAVAAVLILLIISITLLPPAPEIMPAP